MSEMLRRAPLTPADQRHADAAVVREEIEALQMLMIGDEAEMERIRGRMEERLRAVALLTGIAARIAAPRPLVALVERAGG